MRNMTAYCVPCNVFQVTISVVGFLTECRLTDYVSYNLV